MTGATGFVGKHLVRRLLDEGYEVLGLSRRLKHTKRKGLEIIKLDITHASLCQKLKIYARDLVGIIHLAALVPKLGVMGSVEQLVRVNSLSTLRLLEFMRENNIEKFLYASTSSIYGYAESLPVNESAQPRPIDFYPDFYPFSKYLGEIFCDQFRLKYRRKITVLRISAPYGLGYSIKTVIPIFMEKAAKSEDIIVFGSGKRSQDYIYIDDVVEGIFRVFISKDCNGVYNLATGKSTSTLELAKAILAIYPESKSHIITNTQPDLQEGYSLCLEISKLHEATGFLPKFSLKQGLLDFKEKWDKNLKLVA